MILAVVQTAVVFGFEEAIAIPDVLRLDEGIHALQIKWNSPVVRENPHAMLRRLDAHAPIAGVSRAMEVTVIDESLGKEPDRRGGFEQRIANVGGVFALPHPDALFET